MNIAIVDDKLKDREQVERLIRNSCEKLGVTCYTFSFESGEEFLISMDEQNLDLIILDIYMDDMDGMETAREIRRRDKQVQIIFATVTDAFSLSGYDVQATYYLVKPISQENMDNAISHCRAKRMIDSRYIEFLSNGQTYTVLLRNILFARKNKAHIELHTEGGIFKIYMTIGEFAPKLLKDSRFLRVYHGCVVNMAHIKSIAQKGFVMDNGMVVPIKQKGKNELMAAWHSFEARLLHEELS